MKKSCNGCKALTSGSTGMPWECSLGHPIESAEKLWGLTVTYKPLEECEKTKTFKELCKIAPKYIQHRSET